VNEWQTWRVAAVGEDLIVPVSPSRRYRRGSPRPNLHPGGAVLPVIQDIQRASIA
jgi:hypothetical protein